MKTTTLKYSVHLDNENPVYGENATHITLDDEAGGFFFIIEQARSVHHEAGIIRLDPDELEAIAYAGRKLLEQFPDELPQPETT